MAKKKSTDPKIAQLKRYYRIGKRALKQTEAAGGKFARGVIASLAEEEGLPPSTVEKCRQLAQRFEQEDFDELCRLRRTDGEPIGWGHVTRLITVKNARSRQSLVRKVAENDWSVKRLDDEIHKSRKPKQTRGSTHAKPKTTKEAYGQIASMCDQWLRWAGDFATEPKEGERGVWLEDMPEDLQKKLKSVERAMEKLIRVGTVPKNSIARLWPS